MVGHLGQAALTEVLDREGEEQLEVVDPEVEVPHRETVVHEVEVLPEIAGQEVEVLIEAVQEGELVQIGVVDLELQVDLQEVLAKIWSPIGTEDQAGDHKTAINKVITLKVLETTTKHLKAST